MAFSLSTIDLASSAVQTTSPAQAAGVHRLRPRLGRRVRARRRARSEELDLRARLRAQSRAAVVSARERTRADGLLVIEARRERVRIPTFSASPPSGGATARPPKYVLERDRRGLHSWRYGRFEMRGRIDTGRALAGLLDPGRLGRVAHQRRDRHHGVLPRHPARERRVGRREAAGPGVGDRTEAPPELRPGMGGGVSRLADGLGRAGNRAVGRRTAAERSGADPDRQPGRHGQEPVSSAPVSAPQPGRRRHAGRRSGEDGVPGAVRGRLPPRLPARLPDPPFPPWLPPPPAPPSVFSSERLLSA